MAASGCVGACYLGQRQPWQDPPLDPVSICAYGQGRSGADGVRLRGERHGDSRGQQGGQLTIGHVKQEEKAEDEEEKRKKEWFFCWRGRVLGQGNPRVWVLLAVNDGGFLLLKRHFGEEDAPSCDGIDMDGDVLLFGGLCVFLFAWPLKGGKQVLYVRIEIV